MRGESMDSWTKHCIEQMRKRQDETGMKAPPKKKTGWANRVPHKIAEAKKRSGMNVTVVQGGRVSPR